MADRYIVAHNPMTPKTIAWLVVNLPKEPGQPGCVVATCPSERMAVHACHALNTTNNQRVDLDAEPLEGVKP